MEVKELNTVVASLFSNIKLGTPALSSGEDFASMLGARQADSSKAASVDGSKRAADTKDKAYDVSSDSTPANKADNNSRANRSRDDKAAAKNKNAAREDKPAAKEKTAAKDVQGTENVVPQQAVAPVVEAPVEDAPVEIAELSAMPVVQFINPLTNEVVEMSGAELAAKIASGEMPALMRSDLVAQNEQGIDISGFEAVEEAFSPLVSSDDSSLNGAEAASSDVPQSEAPTADATKSASPEIFAGDNKVNVEVSVAEEKNAGVQNGALLKDVAVVEEAVASTQEEIVAPIAKEAVKTSGVASEDVVVAEDNVEEAEVAAPQVKAAKKTDNAPAAEEEVVVEAAETEEDTLPVAKNIEATPRKVVADKAEIASSDKSAWEAKSADKVVHNAKIADAAIAADEAANVATPSIQPSASTSFVAAPVVQAPIAADMSASRGAEGVNTAALANASAASSNATGSRAETSSDTSTTSFREVYKGLSKEAVDQVKVNITKSAVKGVDKIEIQLKPQELGNVEVKLQIGKDGKLQAHIIASRAETMDALQKDVQSLEKAFNDAGFSTDEGSLSFSFRDNQANQNQERENGLRQFMGNAFDNDNEFLNADLFQEASWDGKSALNIRV